MKISTILRGTVVILFVFSLFSTLSIYTQLNNMADNGRVVNFSGIVRGATQRLVKLEVSGMQADALIKKLDDIIRGLISGSAALSLPATEDQNYLANMRGVENAWKKLKVTIGEARKDINQRSNLIAESENYFELTNKAVFAAEEFSKNNVYNLLLVQIIIFILNSFILIIIWIVSYKKISAPLRQLIERLKDITQGNGDLSARIDLKTKDELGELVKWFDRFMDIVQGTIKEINVVMQSIANGDLSNKVVIQQKGDFEQLKNNINQSISVLSQLISTVMASASQVNTGSNELSSSAQALADGTIRQAASLEEISSSINEVNSQSKSNNENATQAKQITNQTLDMVKRGNQQMQEMLKSMDGINTSSTKIAKIIKVIDEIAFQTNLLALNAAVEAARAGKFGKGFAVVAEEVRNLASRSAEAAKNTTELIEDAMKQVENGVSNAGKTAEILAEINETSAKANDMIEEISFASQQQTSAIKEVDDGLSEINRIVQQNSSISEEAASASEELSSQAFNMEQTIHRFKLSQETNHPQRKSSGPNPSQPAIIAESNFPGKPNVTPAEARKELTQKPVRMITLDDDEFGKY